MEVYKLKSNDQYYKKTSPDWWYSMQMKLLKLVWLDIDNNKTNINLKEFLILSDYYIMTHHRWT